MKSKMRRLLLAIAVLGSCSVFAKELADGVPCIDFAGQGIPVKRLNGMCNTIPMKGNVKPARTNLLTQQIRALEIPETRFHDVVADNAGIQLVDVSRIFPLFRADENDPLNYDFRPTDLYLARARELGGELEFRFGEQIEHQAEQFQVRPPADIGKWARICVNIARHYNDGWANGFRWNIRYWEIWNEPDLDADGKWKTNPRTWGGSQESFYEFYATVATHLKKRFPQLKIGGPGFASSPDTADDWGGKFLRAMKGRDVPIDFFSWHRYVTDPEAAVHCARTWRRILDTCGYPETESILDEWNYVEGWADDYQRSVDRMHGLKGAVFTASVMAACQNAPVAPVAVTFSVRPFAVNWTESPTTTALARVVKPQMTVSPAPTFTLSAISKQPGLNRAWRFHSFRTGA